MVTVEIKKQNKALENIKFQVICQITTERVTMMEHILSDCRADTEKTMEFSWVW